MLNIYVKIQNFIIVNRRNKVLICTTKLLEPNMTSFFIFHFSFFIFHFSFFIFFFFFFFFFALRQNSWILPWFHWVWKPWITAVRTRVPVDDDFSIGLAWLGVGCKDSRAWDMSCRYTCTYSSRYKCAYSRYSSRYVVLQPVACYGIRYAFHHIHRNVGLSVLFRASYSSPSR